MKPIALPILVGVSLLCAATAQAANVNIFGKVDTGISYKKLDTGETSSDSISMTSGIMNANRIGIVADEKISDSTTVGVLLETGFNADDGAMKTPGTIFDRGSVLFARNDDLGELAMGRMGAFRYGTTKWAALVTAKRINPFVNGWDCIGQIQYMMPWYGIPMRDNILTYITPNFHGYKVHLQYAMGDGDTNENKPSTDRYAGAALTYDGQQVEWVVMVDTVNENSRAGDQEDSFSITAGGSVNRPEATYYAWGQYFKDVDQIRAIPGTTNQNYPLFRGLDEIEGYSLNLGLKTPLQGGTLLATVGYMYADYDDKHVNVQNVGKDLKRYNVSLGWNYGLSKSTFFYVGATYYRDETEFGNFKNPESYQVSTGIDYSF